MTPKKQKSKVQFREGPDSNQGDEELDKGVAEMENAKASSEPQPEMSEQTAATVTSTESAKKRYGSARGVSAMYKVVVKKAQGKKTKVTCNSLGVPIGENRHVLQSYTGMLARTMIPINHPNWPSIDAELKDKLWLDIQVSKFLNSYVFKLYKLLDMLLIGIMLIAGHIQNSQGTQECGAKVCIRKVETI